MVLNPPVSSITDAEVVVIAVKPQVMEDVLPGIVSLKASRPLVLSVAAGKTIATRAAFRLRRRRDSHHAQHARCRGPRHYRHGPAMPMCPLHKWPWPRALLESLAKVVTVDNEAMIDAVTAVSGSGPPMYSI